MVNSLQPGTIFGGFILDLLIGDPKGFYHPVRAIGFLITALEIRLRKIFESPDGEKIAGIVLLLTVVAISYSVTFLILYLSARVSYTFFYCINVFLIYTIFAMKSLDLETREVYYALKKNDLAAARKSLSYLVSRDTASLDEKDIARGAVETISENIVDGIIAPMFYIFLGGPALGIAYKAISTLDSMVGYKNEKYINFGWASAKCDDLANFIPARLTGFILIPLAALVSGKDFHRSLKVVSRDRNNHKSPNAGHPEAAVAGALGIRLGGASSYFGKMTEKPTIGENIKPIQPEDILEATKLMYLTSTGSILFFTLTWWIFKIVFI